MGIFDKLEGRLERAYNGAFARAFRSEVQPVEIASAIRRAMDDRAVSTGKGRAQVPNIFTIELSETDFERLTEHVDDLDDELIAAAEEHADSQHYRPSGPVTIHLVENVDLETGVFRLRPANARRPDATGYTGAQPRVGASRPGGSWPSDHEGDEIDDVVARGNDWSAAAGGSAAGAASGSGASGRADWRPSAQGDRPKAADDWSAPGTRRNWDELDAPHDDALGGRDRDPTAMPASGAPAGKQPRVKATDRPWFDIDGDRYLLMSARNIIGRDEGCDVGMDDPGVSRRHAEVRVTIDGPHFVTAIRDLGSTNGTFVNGERITTAHLQDGDRVTVGRTTMTYRVRR